MARKEQLKQVALSNDVHERIMRIIDGTDLSATRIVDMMLRKSLAEVESGGELSFTMKKDDSGNVTLQLV